MHGQSYKQGIDLEVLAHLDADVLGQRKRGRRGHTAHQQPARDRLVEGVERGFEGHDAHVRRQRVARQVHRANGRRRDVQQLPMRRLVRGLHRACALSVPSACASCALALRLHCFTAPSDRSGRHQSWHAHDCRQPRWSQSMLVYVQLGRRACSSTS